MPKGKRKTKDADQDNLPSNPIELTREEKEERFIENLFVCPSTTEAAILAGYSESYAYSSVRKRLKDNKFLDRIREYARTHELVNSVPKILQLEDKALEYLARDDTPASELPKFAAILKQKKQIAGLLSQDVAPQQPTISIESVQNLMLNVSSNADSLPGKAQDTHNPLITHNKAD